MSETRGWKQFFDAHALRYDENPFAQHTVAEVDFFLTLYPLSPNARILDVGCGTGRHAIELARRGYRPTGIDVSEAMISVARSKAEAAGVVVDFIVADATRWVAPEPFEAAISINEGALGLIESASEAETHDRSILANIAASLRPNAPFLLTALNGYSIIRQMKDEHVADGRFDPATMVANYDDQWDLPEGPTMITITERLYIPPEMTAMLRSMGFAVDNVFGGTAGYWSQRPLSLDEVEAMYVCRRAK